VKDGIVFIIRRLDGVAYERTWGAETIEDLFTKVEALVETPAYAGRIEVRYDERWGYPTRIAYPSLPGVLGGGDVVTARNFEPVR
jgi:hypothetical protein